MLYLCTSVCLNTLSNIMPKNNKSIIIIAGPCSAENREQVLSTAKAVKEAGAYMFRAGVWKPRTSPDSFAGIGHSALTWLKEAEKTYNIPVATEVMSAEQTGACVDTGIRSLWIGARTTANPFMVQQIADELVKLNDKVKQSLTIMVKNPVNPDIETWCGAIERIKNAGINNVYAIHRGFSDSLGCNTSTIHETNIYRNNPIWSIPLNLQRRMPEVKLICDPSHITGDSSLVATVSQQALNLKYDGLMIEVHPTPSSALSDAKQQLTFEQFSHLVSSLSIPEISNIDNCLNTLRCRIDEIDNTLWNMILERLKVAKQIGDIKHKTGMSIYQQQRFEDMLTARSKWAKEHNLPIDIVQRIVECLHELAINEQL